jgi:hypothetical protein
MTTMFDPKLWLKSECEFCKNEVHIYDMDEIDGIPYVLCSKECFNELTKLQQGDKDK